MKNVLFACCFIFPLTLLLLQPWQADAAYRDTNDFCKGAPCHTGTAGTTEGVPLSESDDKVHDSCSDCHDPGSGQLIGSAAGREGNAVNMCIDCHGGPARFLSHLHHESLNKVSYDNGVNDTSQSGQQGCQECHGSGPAGGPYSLATWSDILFEHNDSCYTCHDYANEPNVGDNTPILADVQAAIANPGSGVTCATCHVPKVPDVDHGSHPADFGWAGGCETCHNDAMYGTSGGPHVLNDVHGGDCTICHSSSPTRDNEQLGDAANGVDGDARKANGTAAAGTWTSKTCLTCHNVDTTTTTVEAHHIASLNNYVTNGNCAQCHTDPRPTPAGMAHAPYQMSCGACHVTVNGDTVEVSSITRGVAGSTANGMPSGNVKTTLTSHTFTITAGTGAAKIANYGTCLNCHGSSGQTAGRAPTGPAPFHGDIGYAGLGGTIAEGQTQFRIAEGAIDGSFDDSPTGTTAYWGLGRGIFNINHAEYSIHDHYLQGQVGWQNNFSGETATFAAMAANIPRMYTFFEMYSTNLGANAVIPVFDTDYIAGSQCSGSCDTVTINTNTCGSKQNPGSCIENRILTIKASSTDSSAQLTVVHGGEATPMSCSNGNCSVTIDYSSYPANLRFDGSNISLNSVWVISDKGGSDRYEAINTR